MASSLPIQRLTDDAWWAWVAGLAAFAGWQARAKDPLLPPRVVLNRNRLLVTGLGIGQVIAPVANTGTFGVAPDDAGVAAATINAGQQVGGSIGTSLLNTMVADAPAARLPEARRAPPPRGCAARPGHRPLAASSRRPWNAEPPNRI
jgi:hypothetical protein